MPPQFFDRMRVLRGSGYGAGTRFAATFNVYGRKETLVMDVTEPEPGRVLQEIDTRAVNITRFEVDPINDENGDGRADKGTGTRCKVTIHTDVMKGIGIFAIVEEWVKKVIMKKMFVAELTELDRFMQNKK